MTTYPLFVAHYSIASIKKKKKCDMGNIDRSKKKKKEIKPKNVIFVMGSFLKFSMNYSSRWS